MNSGQYGVVREILKLFEMLGWVVAGLGACLILVGLSTASSVFIPEPLNPNLSDRLIAAIPGLIFLEAGLIQVVLVKVGLANIDTSEMTRELLDIARKPTPVVVHQPKKPTAIQARSVPNRNQSTEPRKPTKEGEKIYVETYKGMPIHQKHDGHYLGEKWFAGAKQARIHIDNLTSE